MKLPAFRTNRRPRTLLGLLVLVAGAIALMSAATQFVAARLTYHPALGAPWIGHFYAPWAWLAWQRAPWAANATATFRIADSAVMAVMALGMFTVLVLSTMRRRRPVKYEGVHGTARFQSEFEIRRNGLLPRRGAASAGVYVGGWRDAEGCIHYLRHDGPEHAIVIAPTRSGKGVGNIVPTLLSWPASALVYDEKGELWELSAGWRAQQAGNAVLRWEPGAPEGSVAFNPLAEIRVGAPHEVADAQNIALVLCDPKGEGIEAADHWGRTSFDLITAMILHVLYRARAEAKAASLADVASGLSNPDQTADQLWEEMRANRHLAGNAHPVIAAAGRDMLDREARERGSVLSSAKTCLLLFKDPIVAGNTRRSDFRLADLMDHERPVSLYIVTRGTDKERLRPLVRLLLTMAMRRLMGVELKFNDGRPVLPHRHRLLLMLDEFPSLGRMELIEGALPKCAGYGIKAFLAAQDREQLIRAYGPHQSITANCDIRIVYPPNEWTTGKWVSEMVGNTTIVKEDVTESGKRLGPLRNISRTYHEVSRPLLTGAWACAVRPHRRGRRALLAAVAMPLVAIAMAASAGLCVNTTASMPRGLWRVVPTQAPVARGVVVGFCPPDSGVFRQAARRGYIAPGVCPGGYERLLKPVAAVAGDTVSVTAAAIAVNGLPVADTVALARDSAGRPLQPVPPGLYQVRAGEVWLLSGHDPRSFDSRYFGPVPAANIKGVARPLWVVR